MKSPSDYQVTALVKSAGAGALSTAIGPHEKPPWRKAIDSHLSNLTRKELKDLSCPTDPNGLIGVLQDIERRSKSKKTTKFLDFLSAYTTPLQQFQGVIEVVIQINPAIGSPIWAPMKLVLILLKNHNDAYDTLAEQFSLICRKLPLYEAYNELFPSSTALQNALTEVYIGYLDFCFKAANHFRRNAALNFFRSILKPFPEEFKEILNNMDRHRQIVDDTVRLSAWTEQVTTHRSARQEKTLRWLSPSVFDSEFTEFERKWVPGTCGWILQTDEYNDWLNRRNIPGRLGLLWISWPAGYGKSFIAHFLRKSLPSRQQPLFFFFNSKQENSGKRTAVAFLRTILHQLLTRPLDKDVLEACFSILSSIAEESGHDQASSVNSLWEAATEIFRRIPSLYLVIDALDECNFEERNLVLEKLVSIMRSNNGFNVVITSRPEIDIRKVIEDLSIETCFRLEFSKGFVNEDLKKYVEDRLQKSEKFTDNSLRKKVEAEILKRADGMFLYVRLMIDELELEGTSPAVFKRLGNLPKNLIDYYDIVLRKISKSSASNCQLARDIFLWAITAYRPLKVQELISALGAQRRRIARISSNDDVDWPLLGDPRKAILSACFPLIEILEDQTIQVIHTSVTQYLRCQWNNNKATVSEPIPPFAYEISKAHSEVTLVALDFLSSPPHTEHCNNTQVIEDHTEGLTNAADTQKVISGASCDLSDNRSFHSYCVLNWNLHALEAEAYFEEQQDTLFAFCKPEAKALSEWIKARSLLDFRFKLYFGLKRSKVEPSPLHIAVYFNLYQFTNAILLRGFDPIGIDGTGATPLHIAAEQGFHKLTKRMIDGGANKTLKDSSGRVALHRAAAKGHLAPIELLLSSKDIDCLDKMGRSALFIACRYGKESAARKLLVNGADPSLQSISGETPLSTAIINGHLEISRLLFDTGKEWDLLADRRKLCYLVAARKGYNSVLELLLQRGVDLNAVDSMGQNAVYIAASAGNSAAFEVLIRAGVDVNAKDYDGRGSLPAAVESGNRAVVELLLKSGAEVNAESCIDKATIHIAVETSNEAVVELLLKYGAGVNTKDSDGQTTLQIAVEKANEAVVELLLKYGAEVNAKNDSGKTGLHFAAETTNEAMVELLLKSGAEVNMKDNYGRTALHFAAEKANEAMVGLLLKSGAGVNMKDNYSRTALHFAAGKANEAMVELLLKSGAEVNMKDGFSRTALHFAAEKANEAIVELLLKSGAEVNMKDNYSRTALHFAAEKANEAMVGLLLKSGAGVNTKDNYSRTALHFAAEKANEAMVGLLLKSGAEVNMKDNYSRTALHFAAGKADEAMVELLLKSGADVNMKDNLSRTALHTGIVYVNEAVVELLLKYGAEVNAKDVSNVTALHIAVAHVNEPMVELLLKYGAEVNAKNNSDKTTLHIAAREANEAVVGLLLKYGAEVNAKDVSNVTALHIAVVYVDEAVVELLLKYGAEVNTKGSNGQTILHIAIERDSKKKVELLLKYGADPNEVDDGRCTALHIATREGNEFLVQALLESGSIVDTIDKSRYTALHHACEKGFLNIAEELLEADADYSIRNNDGKTPVDLATENGHAAILALFS